MLNVSSPLVVVPYSADQIRFLVSPQRMAPYLRQSDGNPDRALRLYEWSSRMSAAAFETVGHFEVLLRNAIDRALSDHFAERDRGMRVGGTSGIGPGGGVASGASGRRGRAGPGG